MLEKRITKRFRLPISTGRQAEVGHELAGVLNQIDSVDAQRKHAVEGYKAQVELLEQKARRLRSDIDTAKEDIDVEVFVEEDFEANAIRYRRVQMQTAFDEAMPGEILEERAMTAEERERAAQMNIDDAPDGKMTPGDRLGTEQSSDQEEQEASEQYECPIHGWQDGPDCPRC